MSEAILTSSLLGGAINPRITSAVDQFNPKEIIGWPGSASLGTRGQINNVQRGPYSSAPVRHIEPIWLKFYQYDFYYRIHITPLRVDMGNISSTQGFKVVVWNAYFEPKKILKVTGIQSGMSVTPPQPMPFNIFALQESEWDVEISTEGDPQIDVKIEWVFEDVKAPKVHITGMRVFMWPFAPDWSQSIDETLEWATDVLTSTTAAEQRRSLRLSPRKTYKAQFLFFRNDRQYFEMLMSGNGAGSWALPIWTEIQHIDEDLPVEAMEIKCSTAHYDFQPGTMIVLRAAAVDDVFTLETAIIDAVLSDRITLQRPLQQSWPKGSRLYPARSARILNQPQIELLTDEHSQTTITFQSIEKNEWKAKAPEATYRGHPLFINKPDEAQNLTAEYLRMLKTLDNTAGIPDVVDTAKAGFQISKHNLFLLGQKELDEFKQLLYALRGKQVAMWVPTHRADMDLAMDSSNDVLHIKKMGFTHFGLNKPGKRDIYIELTDGSYSVHHITDAVEAGDTERLSIAPLLPQAISNKNLGRISFLMLCRLDTDSVTLKHTTDISGLTQATIVWRSLRDELEGGTK